MYSKKVFFYSYQQRKVKDLNPVKSLWIFLPQSLINIPLERIEDLIQGLGQNQAPDLIPEGNREAGAEAEVEAKIGGNQEAVHMIAAALQVLLPLLRRSILATLSR